MWEFWNIILRYDLNKIINERDCKKRKRINELHEKRLNLFRKLLEPPSYPFLIKTCSKIMLRDAINKIDAEIAQLEREIAEDRYNQSKGESKMDNREELKRSLAVEEERAKDSLANIEKMKKQLEELDKKEEQPTVSATGVYLNKITDKRYFYLAFDNVIFETAKFYEGLENDLMRINNIFATEKQAEQEALRREGQEFIRRCAMLWNNDHDWRKDFSKNKYNIYYNMTDGLKIGDYNCIGDSCPYFDTRELAEKCIKELKEKYTEEQIKVIFGVK